MQALSMKLDIEHFIFLVLDKSLMTFFLLDWVSHLMIFLSVFPVLTIDSLLYKNAPIIQLFSF